MFLGPKTSYMEADTKKDRKMEILGSERTDMCLELELCARALLSVGQNLFLLLFSEKKLGF